MEIDLYNPTTVLLLLIFMYVVTIVTWAWYATVRDRHIEKQLENISRFHEEQWIVNGVLFNKLNSIEDDVREVKETRLDESTGKFIGEYVLLRDDEETEPMRATKE